MATSLTKEQRSYCMSRIRSKNTKSGVCMQERLKGLNLIFGTNSKDLPGSPDITFKNRKIAIFIDSEFWHDKDFGLRKQTYSEYWSNNISRNITQDKKGKKNLKKWAGK
jgi:DNA mismatch endonuclease (patch repair protein)